MQAPSARQQAGYLRRLIRRGEVRVINPTTGKPVPALIELRDGVIRLVPVLALAAPADPDRTREELRWAAIQRRMRSCISLVEAEELVDAVETERAKRSA